MFPVKSLLALVFCFLATQGLGLTDGNVLVDDLNVRKFPNGELVEQLDKDQPVQIVKDDAGWSQIVYLKDGSNNASYGWVASKYIEIVFEAASSQCSLDPIDKANHCLAVMKPDLQCAMDEQTSSFSACSADIRFKLSREQGNLKGLTVLCTSKMLTKSALNGDWQMAVQTSNALYSELLKEETAGNIELVFEFGDEPPVKYFQLAEAQCELVFDAI